MAAWKRPLCSMVSWVPSPVARDNALSSCSTLQARCGIIIQGNNAYNCADKAVGRPIISPVFIPCKPLEPIHPARARAPAAALSAILALPGGGGREGGAEEGRGNPPSLIHTHTLSPPSHPPVRQTSDRCWLRPAKPVTPAFAVGCGAGGLRHPPGAARVRWQQRRAGCRQGIVGPSSCRTSWSHCLVCRRRRCAA